MTRFQCAGCGRVIDLTVYEESVRREHCPVCEETTTWTVAFEGEGASF